MYWGITGHGQHAPLNIHLDIVCRIECADTCTLITEPHLVQSSEWQGCRGTVSKMEYHIIGIKSYLTDIGHRITVFPGVGIHVEVSIIVSLCGCCHHQQQSG